MAARGDTPAVARGRAGRHAERAGLIPLKCLYCGEVWTGPRTGIGGSCAANPLIGSIDVFQCSPEELDGPLGPEEVF
jgi:hypothetical protein